MNNVVLGLIVGGFFTTIGAVFQINFPEMKLPVYCLPAVASALMALAYYAGKNSGKN